MTREIMSGIEMSSLHLAMFGLGTPELMIILLVVVMLFGVGKLPIVAKQLGSGVRNFQRSVRGDEEDEVAAATESKKLEDTSAKGDGLNVAQKEGSSKINA